MNESKDTILKDGQEAPTPVRLTGLRASNTLESLRPKEVNAAAGHFCDGLKYTVSWPRELCSNCPPIQKTDSPVQGRGLPPEQYNLLPVDWPTVQETIGLPKEFVELSLTERVEYLEARNLRLEEQMDGLLDRIAIHNTKSSHKI
jgi:hypothetical protein